MLFVANFIQAEEINPLHGIKINYRYSSRSGLDYIVETNCTSSCAALEDGIYNSCKSCFHFTLCQKEDIQHTFECADNLFWDDVEKDCLKNTSTCSMHQALASTSKPAEMTTTSNDESDEVFNSTLSSELDVFSTVALDDYMTTEEAMLTTEEPQKSTCISNCKGLIDGDYASCLSCSVYASCVSGIIYDGRRCPAGLFWDDSNKLCTYDSPTCQGVPVKEPTETPAPPPVTSDMARSGEDHSCIRSCKGVPDGDYHSCLGCGHYATCLMGVFITRKCTLKDTVWDDKYKMCLSRSQTCKPSRICVEDNCSGIPDGDYHSCYGCGYYSTCLMGVFIDKRQCLKGTIWDNKYKICLTSSNTCEDDSKFHPDPSHPLATDKPKFEDFTQSPTSNPYNCVSSCENIPDGNFQSCKGCNVFASCSGGRLIDSRPCAAKLVWDDIVKQCVYTSSTCLL